MKKIYNEVEIKVVSWGVVTDVLYVSDQNGEGLKWSDGWNNGSYSTQTYMD